MTYLNKSKNLTLSSRGLLIGIQIFVSAGWLIQLVFHQTWMCLGTNLSWLNGFYLSICISCIPLFYSINLLFNNLKVPTLPIRSEDILAIIFLFVIGTVVWWYFCFSATHFPIHTYGDESFHSVRVQIMANDFNHWFHHGFHPLKNHPAFLSEYMFYPALGYVPITFFTKILGNTLSVSDQRISLIIYYLATILTTYLLCLSLIKSRIISLLTSLIPTTSALLLAYTVNFYIEIPYVSILIGSLALLSWGIQSKSKEIITTAVLLSSLAPIIRESAVGAASGIIFAASLWRYFNTEKYQRIFSRFTTVASYFIIGLLPFILYYIAKSRYTDWDKTRTALRFIFQQDYLALGLYSFIYLGPLAILSLLFFTFFPNYSKQSSYLVFAALTGIIGSLLLEAIFIPGYMPWSRNYLFFYADFTLLTILFIRAIVEKWNKGLIISSFIIISNIVINLLILFFSFNNNNFFHESEIVFDFRPISLYLLEHQKDFNNQQIYIYWPTGFPTYPKNLLPAFINLKTIQSIKNKSEFLPFNTIQQILPHDARFLLFYYLKNTSHPISFNTIPAIERPNNNYLKHYHLLVESTDPWSKEKNGVMLLEKIN